MNRKNIPPKGLKDKTFLHVELQNKAKIISVLIEKGIGFILGRSSNYSIWLILCKGKLTGKLSDNH